MKDSITKFIEKHLSIIMILLILWVIISPYILTQFSIISFSIDGSTGQIGDTIGGITAPAIGLVSAFLLYMALTKQIESNKLIEESNKRTEHEANFRIIYGEIEKFENSVQEMFKYNSNTIKGINALETFPNHVITTIYGHDTKTKDLAEFRKVFDRFNKLFYLMKALPAGDKYTQFLGKEIYRLYSENLLKASFLVIKIWKWEEAEELNDTHYAKMDRIRTLILEINESIRCYNK